MQRDGAGCSVGIKCSFHKSQMSLPALAFPPSAWWGADGLTAPGNPPVQFYPLKGTPVLQQALGYISFQRAQFKLGAQSVPLCLFIYIQQFGTYLHTDFAWFSYVYSFPAVWCPKFYKPSISCYIFLYCNKIPILQRNDKLIHMHLYANMIVFVLQNFNALAPN